nr:MAG TPA: hypothetical protein [Caudoviricetes sp.]
MHFFPGNILAARLRQQDPEFIPDIQHSLLLSLVNSDYRAFSSVYLHIAFLFQHGICLIHRMHINTNGVGKLSHTGKYIPLMKTVGSDSQNDLVPQLNIQCLITAEINLYIHIQYASLFFLCFFCYIYSITVSTSCQPFSSDAGACRSSLFQSIPYKDYGKKPLQSIPAALSFICGCYQSARFFLFQIQKFKIQIVILIYIKEITGLIILGFPAFS